MLQALQIATEVNLQLGEILLDRFGKVALNTGDEGGFAPPISTPRRRSDLLHEAVEVGPGYTTYQLRPGLRRHPLLRRGHRDLPAGRQALRPGRMIELYQRLIAQYGIVTIEDPLHEDDFEGFAELTEACGIQIVGDDLFITNPARLRRGLEVGAANSLLWKVNQIGTLARRWTRRPGLPPRLHGRRLRALW